jgi:hypothetical protein
MQKLSAGKFHGGPPKNARATFDSRVFDVPAKQMLD